jgi:DNA polymerase III subunit alpha
MIGKDYDYINPSKMDYKDEKVLKLLREGYTEGIFQFESIGMKETLRQVQPNGVEELAVCNALYRPSSIKFIEHYAKRKRGEEEVTYLHPDLEDILKETYGIWVYQEQMIGLGRLAGLSNPDIIRKAIGKKKVDLMIQVKDELFNGLRKRGWSEEQLAQLWQDMLDYANYSFNRSHAQAYAIIAFQMAKLKVYHPIEFMTALLNSKIDKIEEVSHYISECKRMGIEVKPPNINDSQGLFTIKDGKIEYGLLAIKGIGEPTVNLINKARELHGKPFESFEQFYNFFVEKSNEVVHVDEEGNQTYALEMITTDAIISLIKCGAFGSNKDELLNKYAELTYTPLKFVPRKTPPSKSDFKKNGIEISEEDYKDKETRLNIFNKFKYEQHLIKDHERKMKHINQFVEKYMGNHEDYEFDTLGTYLTISPYDNYKHLIKDFYSYADGAEKILIIGTIVEKEVKKSSKGGQYAKLSLLTPYGIIQGKAYTQAYSEYKKWLDKGSKIVVLAKRSKDEFIISKLKTFEDWVGLIERKRARKGGKQ